MVTCPTHPCLLLGKKGRGVPTLPSPLSPPTCNLNQSKRRPGAGSTRASAGWISLLRIQDSSLSEPLPQVEIQEFCPSTLEESNISTAVRHITSCSLLDKLVANVLSFALLVAPPTCFALPRLPRLPEAIVCGTARYTHDQTSIPVAFPGFSYSDHLSEFQASI